ncbi:MAG: FecR domain-containing protein [Synergistaceae bacterium]|jgi:hypothetical protein|nr:FecR domain-containing protein [Synergistaceae bacterium]
MSKKSLARFSVHSLLALLFLVACVLCAAGCGRAFGAEAAPAGTVIAASGMVEVSRAGARVPLAAKDPVYGADSILTGADGKVQILFDDGSTVNVAPDSSFDMRAYANSDSEPSFAANLFQGAVRIITGTITDRNPEGFEVTTPLATVGIRGTILYIEADDRHSTVKVFNSEKTVVVNGIEVAETFKITVSLGEEPRVEPLAPGEAEADTNSVVLSGGGEVSELPPAEGEGASAETADAGTGESGALMADIAEHPLDLTTPVLAPPAGPPAGPTMARVDMSSGVMTVSGLPYDNGVSGTTLTSSANLSFGFDVNLMSGAITNGAANGYFNGYEGSGSCALTGGTGTFDALGNAIVTFAAGTGTLNMASTWPNANLGTTFLKASSPSGYSDVGDPIPGVLHLQNDEGHWIEFATTGDFGPFPDGSVTNVY